MPRLRVLAGPSVSSLQPISDLVNTGTPHYISSDIFEGWIAVHIKGFTDEHGNVRSSEYFERKDRQDITWSIQVEGRFLRPYSADDILYGNVFERPLLLPWGTGVALQFMSIIDPTLEHDLPSEKPWALSPLISTMPHFAHRRTLGGRHESSPTSFSLSSVHDETSQLYLASVTDSGSDSDSSVPSSASSSSLSLRSKSSSSSISSKQVASSVKKQIRKVKSMRWHKQAETLAFSGARERRAYFSDPQHRKGIVFGPQDVITTDFCYGFLEFTPTLALRLPVGLSFDLVRYWDGQPVRFACCERQKEQGGDPWGRLFWCVSIELVEEDDHVEDHGGQASSEDID